jgi:dienelactone hydrolase
MKRRWKILIGIILALLLLIGGTITWFVLQPPSKAKISEPGQTGRRITEAGLFANYFPAEGAGRKPGILLLGGSEGGLGLGARAEALLLQKAGFNVLQIAYFNAPGKVTRLRNVPLEDFFRALDWLKQQPEVDPESLGVVGYSKGAEAALLVSTRYPGIKATVAGMPSSVVWDSLSIESFVSSGWASSWSVGGEKVPSLPYGHFVGDEKNLLSTFVEGLKKLNEHPDAVIPVERFKGELLLVCGEVDTLWPSCPMTDQIVARAKANGRAEPRVLRYAEAGHGVAGAPDPARLKEMGKLGGTNVANLAARADSWPKIVAFLDARLMR